jgi:hypothetical protein
MVIKIPKDTIGYEEEGDEPYTEQSIIYYMDSSKIHLISVSEVWIHDVAKETTTNYYLKNDSIIFVLRQQKNIWHGATEDRLYFAFNKCIKYLSKSVTAEEDSLVLDALLQNTSNIEKDCEENSILIVENVAYFLELYRKQNINVHN